MIIIPFLFLLRMITAQTQRVCRERKPPHAQRQAAGSGSCAGQRARVSASQRPPPIMKPPEMRDTSRVRRAEKMVRTRPASSA
jgi:hypothetical protein